MGAMLLSNKDTGNETWPSGSFKTLNNSLGKRMLKGRIRRVLLRWHKAPRDSKGRKWRAPKDVPWHPGEWATAQRPPLFENLDSSHRLQAHLKSQRSRWTGFPPTPLGSPAEWGSHFLPVCSTAPTSSSYSPLLPSGSPLKTPTLLYIPLLWGTQTSVRVPSSLS